MQPSDWITIAAIAAAFLSPFLVLFLTNRHNRDERAERRDAEREDQLRAACVQMVARGRAYNHAALVSHARDESAGASDDDYDEEEEDFRDLRAAYVEFAAALAAVEIVAPGGLIGPGREWADALDSLVAADSADPWGFRRDKAIQTEMHFLEAIRRYFGIPAKSSPLPPRPVRIRRPRPPDKTET